MFKVSYFFVYYLFQGNMFGQHHTCIDSWEFLVFVSLKGTGGRIVDSVFIKLWFVFKDQCTNDLLCDACNQKLQVHAWMTLFDFICGHVRLLSLITDLIQ